MSSNIFRSSSAHLRGNVAIQRSIFPLLRSSKRRIDPSAALPVPHYPGVMGLSMPVSYSDAARVTRTVVITAGSDSYTDLIAAINVLDPANLDAVDLDGFLALRNLNPGKDHFIEIPSAGGTLVAPLGFVTNHHPNGRCMAGDYASTPGTRTQSNPANTALIGQDEELSSSVINRALASTLNYIDQLKMDLDREITVVREFTGVLAVHTASGLRTIFTGSSTVRLELLPLGGDITKYIEVVDSEGATAYNSLYERITVTAAHYATNIQPLVATPFGNWGTPDGGSIFHTDVESKVKHPSIAITSILGNVVKCTGAHFDTLLIQNGDLLKIAGATNNLPFSHNGWFAIDRVMDAETIMVRSVGMSEFLPFAFREENRPTSLNPSTDGSLGALTVYIGRYLTLTGVYFVLSDDPGVGAKLRLPVGVSFREIVYNDLGRPLSGNQNQLGNALNAHITDPTDAHAASAISGFTSSVPWQGGSTSSGATLRETIEDVIQDLKNAISNDSGTGRIGAEALTIGGVVPNNIASGSLLSQLQALLTTIRDNTLYASASSWKDGTTVSASTIVGALDEIVSDLSGGAGPAKIGGFTSAVPWKDGELARGEDLKLTIEDVIDGLAGSSGSAKIGSPVSASLAVGSVLSQLTALAAGWGKLDREQTWTNKQLFNGSHATVAVLATTVAPTITGDRKLLWEITVSGTRKVRFYSVLATSALEITNNVAWSGSLWVEDTSAISNKIEFSSTKVSFYEHPIVSGSASWSDNRFRSVTDFNNNLDDISPSFVSGLVNIGDGLLGTALLSQVARVMTKRGLNTANTKTLIWEFKSQEAGGHNIRLYFSSVSGESLEITFNARWDKELDAGVGQWVRDATLSGPSGSIYNTCSKFVINRDYLKVFHRSVGDANFSDNEVSGFGGVGGGWDSDKTFSLAFNSATPAITAKNTLTVKNIVKAWGVYTTGGVTPLNVESYNISSVNYSVFGLFLNVNLANSMDSENFAVFATAWDNPGVSGIPVASYVCTRNKPMVNGEDEFSVSVYSLNISGLINLATTPLTIMVMVLGEEA